MFAAGTNAVTVSYSGSAGVAPVSANVTAAVDVIVDVVEDSAPPMRLPMPEAPTGAAPVANAPRPAESTRSGSGLAHTGNDARTVVALGVTLLAAGIAASNLRRRRHR